MVQPQKNILFHSFAFCNFPVYLSAFQLMISYLESSLKVRHLRLVIIKSSNFVDELQPCQNHSLCDWCWYKSCQQIRAVQEKLCFGNTLPTLLWKDVLLQSLLGLSEVSMIFQDKDCLQEIHWIFWLHLLLSPICFSCPTCFSLALCTCSPRTDKKLLCAPHQDPDLPAEGTGHCKDAGSPPPHHLVQSRVSRRQPHSYKEVSMKI